MRRSVVVGLMVFQASFLISLHSVFADTWRVEKDGTGDFTDIQPAVVASASGDTILIGAGVYNEAHSIHIPGWPERTDAFVNLTKERLTLIGVDPDSVIIGPDDYYEAYYGPIGICGAGLSQAWRIEGVTVHNLWDGIYAEGEVGFFDCKIMNNFNSGIFSLTSGGMTIESSKFYNNIGYGLNCHFPAGNVFVSESEFIGNTGNSIQGSSNVIFENCHFSELIGGVQFDNSTGIVRECQFESMSNFGINSISGSSVIVENCDIQVPGDSIRAREGASLEISGSILAGAYRNIWIRSGSVVIAHGNHILKPGLFFVKCEQYVYPPDPPVLDFTNNYWGTTDLDSIAAGIWDNHDDGNQPVIQFEPISDVPLPAEKKSLGDVKAMFR